jgi:hypothetical protein
VLTAAPPLRNSGMRVSLDLNTDVTIANDQIAITQAEDVLVQAPASATENHLAYRRFVPAEAGRAAALYPYEDLGTQSPFTPAPPPPRASSEERIHHCSGATLPEPLTLEVLLSTHPISLLEPLPCNPLQGPPHSDSPAGFQRLPPLKPSRAEGTPSLKLPDLQGTPPPNSKTSPSPSRLSDQAQGTSR